MKLSEMKELLVARELRLTKSLGQNFLHDRNQLLRIVEAAELGKQDRVLEVGPGLGPLTELLLEHSGQVLAIEKDSRLVQVLRERFPGSLATPPKTGLQLVHDDALDYLRREPRDWSQWKLVANLPYSVASPILVDLAHSQSGPKLMVATLQLEVARRLSARPGSPDYGVLSLLVQLDYEPRGWFKIPATCFFPEPDIDSACISLARRSQTLLPPELKATFVRIIKRSFSQRRKMVAKLLKVDWPADRIEKVFSQLKLSPQARAETLELQQFVRLTEGLSAKSHA
jgi:16S rRNA (adenine1518-N6/adenine1519-N6)-dimethyltransferase